ncbi:MAG: saccharopine dehydrogenase NADP-binding domain-containing protein [Planctomycetes bacterium]|nr:saccharopine dehydrogenase NADP-binding domain-containing protein [Planctomycetota bacterium]
MSRVIVLGGRGFMGGRILRLLPKNLTALAAGRGKTREGYIQLDVHEPDKNVLEPGDVLINTVGPFTYAPGAIVRACLARGAHYVDLAETPAFMGAVREITRGADQPSAVITGCSSVPGLMEVFARQWRGRQDVARVRGQLSIGTNNPSSATLLYSMLAPVGRDGWFKRTWLRAHDVLAARRYGVYPSGLEGGVNLGDRVVPCEFGFGFDRRPYTSLLRLFAPVVGVMPRTLLRLSARLGNLFAPLARPFGSRVGILSLDALNGGADVVDSLEIRASSNGLDVPAWPSVWAAELLCGRTDLPANCTSLADLVNPSEAITRLINAGYEVLNRHDSN